MTVILTHDGDTIGRVPTQRAEAAHAFLPVKFCDNPAGISSRPGDANPLAGERSVLLQVTYRRAGTGYDILALRCKRDDEPYLRNLFAADRALREQKPNRRPA